MEPSEVAYTGVGGVITALAVGIALLIRTLYKGSSEGEIRTNKQYTALLNRYEKRITRLESQVEQQFEAMQELSDEHATCREELAGIYSELLAVHDTACRHARALAEIGHDPGPVPAIRSRPIRPTQGEFLAKQAQQSARLSRNLEDAEPKE